MDRLFRQQINKETVILNNILEQLDFIDISRTFHLKTAGIYILFKCIWDVLQDTSHARLKNVPTNWRGYKLYPKKEMATHSSTLAWKIPWMEEPGRLQSMGSHRVRHNWSDLAAAAEIISSIYSNIIGMKLEINYREKNGKKNTNTCRLNNMLVKKPNWSEN